MVLEVGEAGRDPKGREGVAVDIPASVLKHSCHDLYRVCELFRVYLRQPGHINVRLVALGNTA